MSNKLVAIIAASDSDVVVMSEAAKVLEEFAVPYTLTISSAHRSPQQTIEYVKKVQDEGIKVIIAGASLAAHLAGAIAAHFPLPVIGVPLKSGALHGFDALHATVQMPPGVPVATVAVDGAKNAGILAVQILATGNNELEEKLVVYKKTLALGVEKKAQKLEKIGWQAYLSEKK